MYRLTPRFLPVSRKTLRIRSINEKVAKKVAALKGKKVKAEEKRAQTQEKKKSHAKREIPSPKRPPSIKGKRLLATINLLLIWELNNRTIDIANLKLAYRGQGLKVRRSKNGQFIYLFVSKDAPKESLIERGARRHFLCRRGERLLFTPEVSIRSKLPAKGKFRLVTYDNRCFLFERSK